ncbi:hypothetical protein K4A83_12500 [Spirulina subsalsa FACHB-351]|uniref:Uncharacterized protein n=1 Tax=Spirulina subsalsa FACHB-351 TaxID=234711 RepID=A0ABT3L6E1_9CYAN|nr:hypothetical protein [Spirulina subsalsa]MCW6037081.1 hypothetical protein [Spirulina subsalsa FACHB-351]
MPTDLIVLIAALLITWLVFTWLVKVLKASVKTALVIAGVVLLLQFFFGIDPQELWRQITELPQILQSLFNPE